MKRQRGAQRQLTLDVDEILDAHRRGMTFAQIAEPYGVTKQAVSARLRYHGIAPLKRGPRKRNRSIIIAAS